MNHGVFQRLVKEDIRQNVVQFSSVIVSTYILVKDSATKGERLAAVMLGKYGLETSFIMLLRLIFYISS